MPINPAHLSYLLIDWFTTTRLCYLTPLLLRTGINRLRFGPSIKYRFQLYWRQPLEFSNPGVCSMRCIMAVFRCNAVRVQPTLKLSRIEHTPLKVCFHVPTPSPCQSPSSPKFIIVLIMTARLSGRTGSTPILPIRRTVTFGTIVKLDSDGDGDGHCDSVGNTP